MKKDRVMVELKKLDMDWLKKLCDAMDAILIGGKKPSQIKGATSIRCGLGLALGCIDQTTTMTEAQAWDYLDERNAQAVKGVIQHYKWSIEDWKAKHANIDGGRLPTKTRDGWVQTPADRPEAPLNFQ